MDNITHSLIGALIGQTGLKKLSGLGMPTLIIAANIPDIDAACFLWLDGTEHLGFRRGITHGPLAMLILPLLLTAAMVGFDRWQARRGKRPATRAPVRFAPLYLLALIGTLSHPAFDWLNNYGVRLLEPFSSRWFYGDTLFIIDVWLWAILIVGWFWSRRAEKSGGDWTKRGQVVATVAGLYVFTNGLITGAAERDTASLVERHMDREPTLVVANAVPFEFWRRELVWRYEGRGNDRGIWIGVGNYNLFSGASFAKWNGHGYVQVTASTNVEPPDPSDFLDGMAEHELPRAREVARHRPDVAAFLMWSRMPVVEIDHGEYPGPNRPIWTLSDQRYSDPRVAERFTIRIPLDEIP